MKGLCRTALAILVIAACGRDGAITEPTAPTPPALQPGVLALGVDSTTGASIETNKDDYSPGEVVHLVGRGWAPGETVNLHMVEEPNTHADVDTNVVADASGGFSIHFYDVQTHDWGVTFTLTATGVTSGSVAVATFTDGIYQVALLTNPPGIVASIDYVVRNGCAVSTGASVGTYTTTRVPVNANKVLVFRIPSPAGYTFQNYSASSGLTVSAIAPDSVCVTGGSPSGPDQNKDVTLNYTAVATNATPTADAGGAYSGTEGSDIALDGTGSSDSDGSIVSYAWTYQVVTAHATASCTITNPGSASLASIECTDNGAYSVTLTVTDDDGASDDETVTLTVTNANPVAGAGGAYTGNEGGNVSLTGSKSDAGSNDTHGYKWTWAAQSGVDNGATCSFSDDTALSPTVSCTDDGVYTLTLEVTDDDNGTDTDDATLTLSNVNPTAGAGGPYSGNEGANVSLTGSKSDPGSNDTHSYKWTWAAQSGVDNGAACAFSDDTALSPTVSCTDDGIYTLTLTVTDDDLGQDSDDATLTLGNVNPTIAITSHVDGALFSLLNGPLSVTGAITDAGSNDTHQCRLELDGVLDETGAYANATGLTCSPSVLPDEAGVYTLTIRVKDDDGGEGTASIMIVVYDPSAGFVTGGGWINSPAGAYKPNTTLTGKATFGFVSKYKKGANIPEGNTEFQFHAGGMNFHSTTYQWLVVNQAGTNAQFKGTGTINGAGSYTFMLWATDGGNTGDKFRIQITDNNNGDALVYDNGLGGLEQLIASGSIVIHTGGKK